MKKIIKLCGIFLGLFCIMIFNSCEDFLASGQVKDDIIEAIAHNNAPASTLVLKAPEGTGDFLSSGEKSCKLGYSIDVKFTVKSDTYVYAGMEAVSKSNTSISMDEYVEFTDISPAVEKNNGTYTVSIKLLKLSDDILIRPKCLLIPKIISISPAFSTTGCDQDSNIEITFNKKMQLTNFDSNFNGISIYSTESELDDYYLPPSLTQNGTVLVIPANSQKKILPPDSGKKLDIMVRIDLHNLKDEDGLLLNYSTVHSYRINDSYGNQKKDKLLVNSIEGTGSFISDGDKECSVGYTFDLQFTVNSDKYMFTGLEAVDQNDTSKSMLEYVSFVDISTEAEKEDGIYTIKVFVQKETENTILIRPVCVHIPHETIRITGSNGKFNPSKGTYDILLNRNNQLGFDPDSEYVFLNWEIYNAATNEIIENENDYIEIKNPDLENTTYKLKQKPAEDIELAIRPVVAERPQIISYFPTGSGVIKGSAIQIIFDHPIDPSCIYYTQEEYDELTQNLTGIFELWKDTIDDQTVYHGFAGRNNGVMQYSLKNISITDKKDGKNILFCFGNPYFENETTLIIPFTHNSGWTSKAGAELYDYKQILVTLDKGFFYKQNDKIIEMSGSKKWMYQLSNEFDNTSPKFAKRLGNDWFSFKLSKTDENELSPKTTTPAFNTQQAINELDFIIDNNIYLDVKVEDTGSGPRNYFEIKYNKIADNSYNPITDIDFKPKKVLYSSLTSQEAIFEGTIDLSDLDDGIYQFYFSFPDRLGRRLDFPDNSNDNFFYIVKQSE